MIHAGETTGEADAAHRRVMLTRPFAASVDRVWAALTDPSEISRWIGACSGPTLSDGSAFTIDHDAQTRSTHVVATMAPQSKLVLSWDFPDEPASEVDFSLRVGSDGTTVMTVVHVEVDETASYAAGWHRHLDALAAHLAGDAEPMSGFWDDFDQLAAHYASGQETAGRADA